MNRVELGRTRQSEVGHAAQARFVLGTELLKLIGHLPSSLKILAAIFALLEILLQLVDQVGQALDLEIAIGE